jgi:hypothetical protein
LRLGISGKEGTPPDSEAKRFKGNTKKEWKATGRIQTSVDSYPKSGGIAGGFPLSWLAAQFCKSPLYLMAWAFTQYFITYSGKML